MKINKNTKWGDVDKDLSFLDKKEPMINKDIMKKQYDLGRAKGYEEKIIDKDIMKKIIFSYVMNNNPDIDYDYVTKIEKEFDIKFSTWYKYLGEHFENDFNNK